MTLFVIPLVAQQTNDFLFCQFRKLLQIRLRIATCHYLTKYLSESSVVARARSLTSFLWVAKVSEMKILNTRFRKAVRQSSFRKAFTPRLRPVTYIDKDIDPGLL